MDRMKMRFRMDIKWFFTMHFDETNANGQLITYKAGPVRIIKRTLFWIDILYIPVTPSVAMDFVFYTNGMVSPSILDVTYNPESTVNEGSYLMFALDFSDSYSGSKVYTEKMKEPVIMDGVMSEREKNLSLKDQMWYVVYKEGETGFITQLVCDEGLKDVVWEIKYIDDKDVIMKPEREPGQHLLGFWAPVTQFPKGKFKMNMYTYMNKNWKMGVEKRYLDFITHPLRAECAVIK